MQNSSSFAEVIYTFNTMTLHGLAVNVDKKDNVVLCLHGWLDNAASFVPLMPFLQQKLPSKYIVAIDWPGHGRSTHRSLDAHYHFIDWVYDLLQLFESKQWQQVDIVAHSMGGMVASAFAAAFPEKVNSLTLIDSIGFLSAKSEQTTKQLRDGMLSRFKSNNKQVKTQTKKLHPTTDSAIKARVAVSDLEYEQAKLLVERGLLQETQGYRWRSDIRLRNTSPYRMTLKQAKQFISDITCPVQLIYGSKGMDMVSSGLELFGPLFDDFISVELCGGHHVHMEQPKQTAKLIECFLVK
ncbi:MAG: alpha/beta hydrolase [Litorilituus sp.]|nr:alpha/beta hydrolase [Litorilituus sp.]